MLSLQPSTNRGNHKHHKKKIKKKSNKAQATDTEKGAWTTIEKTKHKQNNTHKNHALGFSKINTNKKWRSALGWKGGRLAPINAATRRRWEIGAATTPIGTAATPIIFYLTWIWVCVGRVTGQWRLKEKKMKWKELREAGRLTILTDIVLRLGPTNNRNIWVMRSENKNQTIGYFKWWVMKIKWWVISDGKKKSKQGLSFYIQFAI